jgi:hypothetical protein
MTRASASVLQAIARAHRLRPADYRDNLPAQQEFMDATERRVIWFGHNGGGKTEALCRRLVHVFEGKDGVCHQGKTDLTILLVVTNYDAASARDLADQLHALCPPGLIAQVPMGDDGRPTARCSPWYGRGKGFRGRPPRVVVQSGPMRGTTLNVSTLGAGELAAAGITADLILVNEPITRALMDELGTRDRAGALGYLWYVLTPIPGAPDQTWIPEYVADVERAGGSIRYIQTELTREALVFPSGRALESWEEKTAPRIASWDPVSRPMRMGQSLEPIMEDAYFSEVWRDELIQPPPVAQELYLVGSLDHSLTEGRMRIGVTGFRVVGTVSTRKLIGYDLIDVKATGARIDEAAELFLSALDDAGIALEQIDQWVGDRATSDMRHLVKRDNREWVAAVLRALRSPKRCAVGIAPTSVRVPRSLYVITTPKKFGGSSWHNMNRLRRAMAADPSELYLHPRCCHIVEDIQRWSGAKASPHKDGLDRLGYAWEAAQKHFGLWR